MATSTTRNTKPKKKKLALSTFELKQEIREINRKKRLKPKPKPKPDTYKVRRKKNIIT